MLVPAMLGLLVLWPVTRTWFFSDDFYWINFGQTSLNSPYLILTHRFFNYYRPVINAIFSVESLWANLNAFPRHILNLALHLASSSCLALWLFRLTKSSLAAIAGSILFLLGPVHLESLIWISGRTDLTACFFLLLTLLLLPDLNSKSKPKRNRIFSLTALVLALFSKETAVLAPGVILISDWIQSGKQEKFRIFHWLKQRISWVLTATIALFVHVGIQVTGELTFGRFSQPITLTIWLKNVIGGVTLSIMQSFPKWFQLDSTGFLGFSTLLLLAVLLLYAGNRLVPGGLIMAVLLMIPSAAVPFLILPEPHLTFGRFIYIPMIGSALLIAGALKIIWGGCFICMYRPALAIMIFLLMLTGDIQQSSNTIDRWHAVTSSQLRVVEDIRRQISVVPNEKQVIIVVPDANIHAEMFHLFCDRDIQIVRSPEGLEIWDNYIFVFDSQQGVLRKIAVQVL
ncbi:hypothetical protein K8T06_06235 [bacterium]|nr:hypothetical protein [bacterium]